MQLKTKMLATLIAFAVGSAAMVGGANYVIQKNAAIDQGLDEGHRLGEYVAQTLAVVGTIPEQVETIVGRHMVAEAHIAARLIAAMKDGGESDDAIRSALADLTERTAVSEFWVSDENGVASLNSVPVTFTFDRDPASQSAEFYKLIEGTADDVVQEAAVRDLDGEVYKYVGVPGVDQPRIVQVGLAADVLTRMQAALGYERFAKELVDAGAAETITIVDGTLSTRAVAGTGAGAEDAGAGAPYTGPMADAARTALDGGGGTARHDAAAERITVVTPVADADGRVTAAAILTLDATNITAALERSLSTSGILAAVLAVVGLGLAWLLSRQIFRPLRPMVGTLNALAAGDTAVAVPGRDRKDEIGTMARSVEELRSAVVKAFRLNQMVEEQPARVMMCDPKDLRITYANKAARDLLAKMENELGCSADDVIGRQVTSFHKRPEFVEKILKDPANLPYSGKFTMGKVVIENTVIPIHDANGDYVGPMLNWQDVTAYVQMADDFEKTVRAVASGVSGAAEELKTLAGGLVDSAEDVGARSTAVASASEQAGVNVQTVASASEQLSASIAEISRSVGEATRITGEAVDQVEAARKTVGGLNDAADRIGQVVSLITDIASQTNLLALNATIEAARAGEAGKGFAVVANEVKSLAGQTSRATEDISRQIEAVQQATRDAVTAMDGIGGVIEQVSEIASTVAAAVEEQGAATAEISRNVQEAAAGTADVSQTIGAVAERATDSSRAARTVLESSRALAGQADTLSGEVESFLTAMRA
ncbi:Methyl-accepting chemotaxis protein [Caenispirillum salinarum AK4]|uniref:Methyl-accepting chemotaxis protein n=1 Tax=Caenispirillum salinarum AK4 TaxID=1238182 RepID=K9GR22_9PROT|nr:methyl-accepting chemotaxis protein [Caenispirillum salinarum]EKV28435.1 Methyl-accepting chemotaxis protein [Caenispirillum salinarum AK4]